MNSLVAVAVALGLQADYDGIRIHLARQQAERDFQKHVLEVRKEVAEQKREWKKARTRYLRAIKARNRRAARLARQEMGAAMKAMSIQNQANRRAFFHRTGR